jgi:hypothetical protein
MRPWVVERILIRRPAKSPLGVAHQTHNMPIATVRHLGRKYQIPKNLAVEYLPDPVSIDVAPCYRARRIEVPS